MHRYSNRKRLEYHPPSETSTKSLNQLTNKTEYVAIFTPQSYKKKCYVWYTQGHKNLL